MRALRTRWHVTRGRRWRVGLMRHEWWIGTRYDFASDAWIVGLLGLVLVVQHA